jgi:hypothetical protein
MERSLSVARPNFAPILDAADTSAHSVLLRLPRLRGIHPDVSPSSLV